MLVHLTWHIEGQPATQLLEAGSTMTIVRLGKKDHMIRFHLACEVEDLRRAEERLLPHCLPQASRVDQALARDNFWGWRQASGDAMLRVAVH